MNIFELNNFVFDKTSNKVMLNVDVLGACVFNKILGDVDGFEIVTIQCHTGCCSILCDTIILQYAFHLDKLRTIAGGGNIFFLCCRQRYAILF